jgi:hypothetical protein
MKLNYLFFSVLALLTLPGLSHAQNTSATVTTTFSNMAGANGEDSSVVYSDRSGSPILKNSGFIAIGTFDLDRSAIETLSSATDLSIAFNQFGDAANFNATEDGAFQASASGNPSVADEKEYIFDGKAVYVVVGDGTSLEASSEFLVWKSDRVFDGGGPTGGPSEVILSVDGGDLIIGRSGEDTFDFTDVGGEAGRAAFTAVMIDSTLDDHGDSNDTATFIAVNSSTSGNIKDGDDVDYFRVDLSEEGNLLLRIDQDLKLTVYDISGNIMEAAQNSGDGLGGGIAADIMISKDLAAGTYFVMISGYQNINDLDYKLESMFVSQVNAPSKGSFVGLLRSQSKNKASGIVSIKVTNKRKNSSYFTGRIAGTSKYSNISFKGRFNVGAKYRGRLANASGIMSDIEMGFVQDISGRLSLAGVLISPDGKTELFNLSSRYYNNTSRKPTEFINSPRYTYIGSSPTSNLTNIPAGDAIWYGGIFKKGKVKIVGWSNSGYKYTYKGYLQDGNQIGDSDSEEFQLGNFGTIPFYARSYGESRKRSKSFNEWMLGTIKYDLSEAGDLIRGDIRYVKPASNSLYYPAGFDEDIVVQGSKYSRTGFVGIPMDGFEDYANNAQGDFEGPLPGGSVTTPYVFTWISYKGRMRTAKNTNYKYRGTFRKKHGFFTGKFVDYMTDKSLYVRGVVQQDGGLVSGHAVCPEVNLSLRHGIVPYEAEIMTDSP